MKISRYSPLAMTVRGAIAGLLMVLAPYSFAGIFDDEEARKAISDLRQKIESVRQDGEQRLAEETKRSAEEASQIRRSLIELQNQLEVLKSDLAKLRGQDEQIARDVSDMQQRQKDAAQQIDDRLRKLEPVRVTLDGREFSVEPAEKRDYEAALAVFRKGDFLNAQIAFVDFLNRNGQSGYRTSALFWLGNAQYATKDYKEALSNFRALVSSAADHLRVPEALLAIANCQLELKDTKSARKTLEELVNNYPKTEAASAAKDRLARFK
jgi:tol-pal system protein YbgF